MNNEKKMTTVQIPRELLKRIHKLKVHGNQAYYEVIEQGIKCLEQKKD